ncbi:acid protease [Ophiobolus disseminans]|uniref:Acid protease n=1 Tax=Ophiobolus disseminans TaxID=1469910 RepID=A0A6A7AA42_9PLEO|nr:acid protease [Ophiobolus disseminans]
MMHFISMLALAVVALTTAVHSNVRAVGAAEPSGSFVKLPLHQMQVRSSLSKRQTSVPVDTEDLGLVYIVDGLSERSKASCLRLSRYDPLNSTTARIRDESFNITYGTGSSMGPYFTDDFRIGSLVAKNASFGVAAATVDCEAGILGIGPKRAESAGTVVEALTTQGQINSHVYALDLKPVDETGSIVLGGIDTKKYKSLTKVRTDRFRSYLTQLAITLPNKTSTEFDPAIWRGNNSNGLPVLFDMGTPTNLLPNALYFAIGSLYPDAMSYDSGHGWPAFKVPCDAPHGSFDYTFDNVTIKVSLKDSLHKNPKINICSFGFTLGPQDSGRIPFILGDSFMRGAYMVFDLDNDEIWMGETADCGSNIVPVGKGKDAVPVVPGCGSGAGTESKPTQTGYVPPPAFTAMK